MDNSLKGLTEAELLKIVDDELGRKAGEHTASMRNTKPSAARHTAAPSNVVSFVSNTLRAGTHDEDAQVEFIPMFNTCDRHGRYPINYRDERGITRFTSGHCPQCAAERQRAENERKYLKMLSDSKIPKRFIGCTLETFVAETEWQSTALKIAKHYAKHFAKHKEQCNSLIFRGDMGTGKTHLAYAIAHHLIKSGFTVRSMDSQEYLDWYNGMATNAADRTEAIAELAKTDLIIMDEVGRTPLTKGTENALFRLINARYLEVAPMLLITNLDVPALKQYITDVGYDRLRQGEKSAIVNFTGESWRAKKGGAV